MRTKHRIYVINILFGEDQLTCQRAQTVQLPRREQEDKDDTAKNVAIKCEEWNVWVILTFCPINGSVKYSEL